MKKLFDSKFLIISAVSIITLILLIVFSFSLFNREEAEFTKSGYIINPLSSTTERYFFESGTGYRENLSSMVVFTDVDKNEAKVLRESFVHYDDGSISLLKNGAILDVDSIHNDLALIYNVTSKSVIEKKSDGYTIESINGNINLKNFIIRISDNKYLVSGNLKLNYKGSSNPVEATYFEVVYVEEGIVNIENKDVKLSLPADGTTIAFGDYILNLDTKALSHNNENIMSITAITIDGNENVEILPKEETKEEDNNGNNGGETGNDGNTNVNDNDGTGENAGDGEEGSGGSGGGTSTSEITKYPKISLKEASVGPTNVDVTFDIENEEDDAVYKLQVINAETGKTVDINASIMEDVKISVNLLTPSTKYLFTVVNSETNEQYFQKIFKTDSFGISLEKSYAKDDSLTYRLSIGEDTKISDATLTLYKFDEELGSNVETGKSLRLSDISNTEDGNYYLTFDGLESNTIYTAVLDNFSFLSKFF